MQLYGTVVFVGRLGNKNVFSLTLTLAHIINTFETSFLFVIFIVVVVVILIIIVTVLVIVVVIVVIVSVILLVLAIAICFMIVIIGIFNVMFKTCLTAK